MDYEELERSVGVAFGEILEPLDPMSRVAMEMALGVGGHGLMTPGEIAEVLGLDATEVASVLREAFEVISPNLAEYFSA